MKEVLKKIKPGKEEVKRFKLVTSDFMKKLNSKLKDAVAILGGSGAKDTWLSGTHDVDIFVAYDFQKFFQKSSQLSELLQSSLKKAFPKSSINRMHGSRDYFQIRYENLAFEIVPILKIKKAEEAVNITDVSPLHSLWVNKNAKNIKDEIRLAKQFCRANRIYGAESHIQGFSGYVLEILTAYYGSFVNLLKASQKWGVKEVIDPSKFYKKDMALFHINNSKLLSPLIIVDPVDKTRNAAAALSNEKFLLFKKRAKQYLQKPNQIFFEKKEVTFEELKKEKKNVVYITAAPLDGKIDVVGAKLLKTFNYLESELKKFGLKKSGWEWEEGREAVFYFVLERKELPKFEVRSGPPVKLKEFAADFREKNQEVYVEKERLMAKIKVQFPELKDFVDNLLKEVYVKERIKKINSLKLS
ncbi:MAG: CCA tRNA nucleotidyltransferase [Nanoarchaeota archaeon]|nr:CCA tRNA nucleotidyltransferase [Nanoarchaeota archaeon]MBU1644546.1 CCA tRNA nucleotidyltransferase [Nanoarchaeota archaeon]MBU1976839.1 CCA tRNA nucleotidyltransferase [Nanoarchaeota archaeon]